MSYLVFDIEGDGLLLDIKNIWCIHTYDTDTGELRRYWDSDVVHPILERTGTIEDGLTLLEQNNHRLCAHNGLQYDLPAIQKVYGIDVSTWYCFDTLILSKFLKPKRFDGGVMGHSVEAYGKRFGIPKEEHEDWTTHSVKMVDRCEGDVILQAKILNTLLEEVGRPLGTIEYALSTEFEFARFACMQAEHIGFPFKAEEAKNLIRDIETEMKEVEERVHKYLGYSYTINEKINKETKCRNWCKPLKKDGTFTTHFMKKYLTPFLIQEMIVWGEFSRIEYHRTNLNSQNQVKKVLLRLGWKPSEWNFSKKTKKVTSPKLTEDSFHTLPEGVGQDIARYLVLKHRHGYLQSQLDNLNRRGFVPCYINSLGTEAHRVTHKVLVNTPASGSAFGDEIRSLYYAPEHFRLVGVDLEGAHLRIITDLMQDTLYKESLESGDKESGTDNHSLLAKKVGISRNQAKTLIYSVINGTGARGLAKSLGMQESQARKVLRDTEKALPKYKYVKDSAVAFWRKTGYIETKDGRRLFPHKVTEVISYYLLATEAGVMKRACNLVLAYMRAKDIVGWMPVFQHDEIQLIVEEGRAEEVKEYALSAISQASHEMMQHFCHQVGDARIGESWLETH